MSSWRLFLCAAAFMSVAIAQTSTPDDDKNRNPQQLSGSWVATARAANVPLPPLRILVTFHREGTVIESRRLYLPGSPLGPVLATPGHGEWIRTGNREFAVTTLLFYQAAPNVATADGELVGTEKVRWKLNVSPDGNRFEGTVLVEIRDRNGIVLFSGPGSIEGARIVPELLP